MTQPGVISGRYHPFLWLLFFPNTQKLESHHAEGVDGQDLQPRRALDPWVCSQSPGEAGAGPNTALLPARLRDDPRGSTSPGPRLSDVGHVDIETEQRTKHGSHGQVTMHRHSDGGQCLKQSRTMVTSGGREVTPRGWITPPFHGALVLHEMLGGQEPQMFDSVLLGVIV